jgi:hypothetical protein
MNGILSFSLAADPSQMPNSKRVVDAFVEELEKWHLEATTSKAK